MAKELTDLEALELEERKQALESRKIQDLLARIQLTQLQAELETKTNNKKRGQADAAAAIADLKAMQARCNHRTGGAGAIAIANGQGDVKRPTCIGGQIFLNDVMRLVCQRCRSEWWSNDPDRAKWAYAVELWKESINKEMMIIGGLKTQKISAVA